MGDVSDCSDDVEVEELYGIEDFSDLEDEVFLPGDDAWMQPLTVDHQYDADDEDLDVVTSMLTDQPLATLAQTMSPPASPTMMDQPPPPLATLALMMPPPASPTPPIDIPTRSAGPGSYYYSPITPSPPPPMMSPSGPTPPPRYWPMYSPITPPTVPTVSSATAYTPTLTEVMSAVSRLSPTMAQILAADAKEGPPTLEMLRSMPQQTIAPRVGGYYSAISDDEEDGAAAGM